MKSLKQHIQENLQVNESKFDTIIQTDGMKPTDIATLEQILKTNNIKYETKGTEIHLDWFKLDRKLKIDIEAVPDVIFEH